LPKGHCASGGEFYCRLEGRQARCHRQRRVPMLKTGFHACRQSSAAIFLIAKTACGSGLEKVIPKCIKNSFKTPFIVFICKLSI
jgi:hypothetical protein